MGIPLCQDSCHPLIKSLNVVQGAGEEDVKRYSPERKEAVLKKLAPPHNLSVPELSEQEGTGRKDRLDYLRKTAKAHNR